MAIIRSFVRWGLIGGIALGGAAAVLGPQRVMSGLHQMRMHAQEAVEARLDETLSLRRELKQLAEQYPEKIASVQTDIAEIDRQLEEFAHDREVGTRVIALAGEDLEQLADLVARAESAAMETTRPVSLRWEGSRFSLDDAYRRGEQIRRTLVSYEDKVAHAEVQIDFLGEQKTRLEDLLADLQGEFETYRSQLWQLDREIEAIERNTRLIEMTEQQVATLEAIERQGRVTNLDQVQAKLDEIKRRQEAQLEQLRTMRKQDDYESRVRMEMFSTPGANPFDYELEIDADHDGDDECGDADAPSTISETRRNVAFAQPLVIE